MSERWCPSGQHFRLRVAFRVVGQGVRHPKLARDCTDCERAARMRTHAKPLAAGTFPGVDIDRIHHKLGAVRKPSCA